MSISIMKQKIFLFILGRISILTVYLIVINNG